MKLKIPFEDRNLWWGLSQRLELWLREIGPSRCVKHSGGWTLGGQAMALYFRTLEDAQACVAAFPELALADGVGSGVYSSLAVWLQS